MKANIFILFSLAFSGMFLANFSVKALNTDSTSSSNLKNHQVITVAQNQNQNVLTEAELKARIAQFTQTKNCRIPKQQPKQQIQGDLTQTLLNCIGYSFEVVDGQSSQPSTGLTVKRYPILVLQKGNQYKVRFSEEAKVASPRIIITFTEDGSAEFGDSYTPAKRARIITEKFNQHFIQNGNIKVPSLSKGIVNGQAVVCAASQGNCNSKNVLWTLKSSNRRSDIIAQLNLALKGEAGGVIYESEDPQLQKELENPVNMTQYVNDLIDDGVKELQQSYSDQVLASELRNNQNWDEFQNDQPEITEKILNNNNWQEIPNNNNSGENNFWDTF